MRGTDRQCAAFCELIIAYSIYKGVRHYSKVAHRNFRIGTASLGYRGVARSHEKNHFFFFSFHIVP